MKKQPKKVVIIYDRNDPKQRRTCFWEKIIDRFDQQEVSFRFLSISESFFKQNPAAELFSRNRTDIIIINWDAINTDPVYGSDQAYIFFLHYVPDMDRWVKQGGVIIVESQSASSRLVQNAYDIFTFDSETMEKISYFSI